MAMNKPELTVNVKIADGVEPLLKALADNFRRIGDLHESNKELLLKIFEQPRTLTVEEADK